MRYPSALPLLLGLLTCAAADPAADNPFACLGESEAILGEMDLDLARRAAEERLKQHPLDAHAHCVAAELMRKTGDARAPEHYRRAIAAAPQEAGYELIFANYWRIYRGAHHPMENEAKTHLNRALEKAERRRASGQATPLDATVLEFTRRALINLHMRDGFPLVSAPAARPARHEIFYATFNCLALATEGCDEYNDARLFTLEALNAETYASAGLEIRDARDFAGAILRSKEFLETAHRLRYRGPVTADLFYKRVTGRRAVIPNYYQLEETRDLEVDEFGLSLKRAVDLYPLADVLFYGTAKRLLRTGAVEFFPEARETLMQYEAGADLGRFLGPDKVTLRNFLILQDISPWHYSRDEFTLERSRLMHGTHLDFALYRPIAFPWGRVYTRGFHFFAGWFRDMETFGDGHVAKQDLYAGTSLRGVGAWDLSVQPTLMSHASDRIAIGQAGGRIVKDGRIYRTYLTALYRLYDEERVPGLPAPVALGLRPGFVHLVLQARHDQELSGLSDRTFTDPEGKPRRYLPYDNYHLGAELWSKWFAGLSRPASFLIAGGVHYKDFHAIGQSALLGNLRLNLGF